MSREKARKMILESNDAIKGVVLHADARIYWKGVRYEAEKVLKEWDQYDWDTTRGIRRLRPSRRVFRGRRLR